MATSDVIIDADHDVEAATNRVVASIDHAQFAIDNVVVPVYCIIVSSYCIAISCNLRARDFYHTGGAIDCFDDGFANLVTFGIIEEIRPL